MAGLSGLIPLFILFAIIAIGGYVGYHMMVWSNELAERGKKKMEKKNVSFTKDGGLKVNVKEMSSEEYADRTQNVLVNTWNNASFPAYKSRLGWNSSPADKAKSSPSASPRPGASRENSDRSRTQAPRSSSSALQPPEQKGSARRSASPLPGGWD